jgi:hypothetical protein
MSNKARRDQTMQLLGHLEANGIRRNLAFELFGTSLDNLSF